MKTPQAEKKIQWLAVLQGKTLPFGKIDKYDESNCNKTLYT